MERDDIGTRRVDPYQLLYQGGQFYVVGRSHERNAIRVFRLSRIRGKVGYATKAEHDFQRPDNFDPRAYANRIDWQFGEPVGTAEVWIGSRIAWQIERHFGRYGEIRSAGDDDVLFVTPYANARQLIAWVLGLGENARIVGPPELVEELRERVGAAGGAPLGRAAGRRAVAARPPAPSRRRRGPAGAGGGRGRGHGEGEDANGHRADAAIRPERFARLVTLASILIDAGRAGRLLDRRRAVRRAQGLRAGAARGHRGAQRRQLRRRHLRALRRDPSRRLDRGRPRALRRLVRAPGAAAPGGGQGADRGHRPDRRAHPRGVADLVRQKVVDALGEDPVHEGLQFAAPGGDNVEIAGVVSSAIASRRMLTFEYYKENEDEFTTPPGRALRADQRPRGLVSGQLRPHARQRPPLPAGPHQVRLGHRRVLRGPPRRRPGRRRRRLAQDRRGPRLQPRPRVDLPRARALGPRGAPASSPSCRTAR